VGTCALERMGKSNKRRKAKRMGKYNDEGLIPIVLGKESNGNKKITKFQIPRSK
jgi:hypothetical protein